MAKDQRPGKICVQIVNSGKKQRTVSRPFVITGKGLHHGKPVQVVVHPGEVDQGIVFHVSQNQRKVIIPSHFRYLQSSSRNSSLVHEDILLSTVEHFLAASWGVGIDNLSVEVEGEETELPAGDGSCAIWLDGFQRSGFQEQEALRWDYQVQRAFWVGENGRYLFVLPSDVFKATYFLDHFFGSSFVQCMSFFENQDSFGRIANARTFAFQSEVQHIIQAGLGQGVRETALILDENGQSMQPFTLMGEPGYHKIIDLIGDLMLIGHRVMGHFIGLRSGHAMNHQMVKLIAKRASLFDENRSESDY